MPRRRTATATQLDRSVAAVGAPPVPTVGGAIRQLPPPPGDLRGVDFELLGDLGDRLVVLHRPGEQPTHLSPCSVLPSHFCLSRHRWWGEAVCPWPQEGDPNNAASAIAEALEADVTPLRLQLGADPVTAVRDHSAQLLRDLEAWKSVGLSTSY